MVSGEVLVRELAFGAPELGAVMLELSLDLVASALGDVRVFGEVPVFGELVPVFGEAVELGFCVVALLFGAVLPF